MNQSTFIITIVLIFCKVATDLWSWQPENINSINLVFTKEMWADKKPWLASRSSNASSKKKYIYTVYIILKRWGVKKK